ncbi:MAG: hypothetical protein ACUVRA_07395 [Candidatus Bathyarchaeaceae archaeon]
MGKIDLMTKFMNAFVGNGFHLLIKDYENSFSVHTIEIIQKIDDSCPVKDIPIGDYFLRLLVTDENNREASILCNWSEKLLQNLLDQHLHAKEAGCNKIVMFRASPNDPNNWLLTWGDGTIDSQSETSQRPQPLGYIL